MTKIASATRASVNSQIAGRDMDQLPMELIRKRCSVIRLQL